MSTTTRITDVLVVGVPVSDQDKALTFYTETLGFETKMDAEIGPGMRWVEVEPPGSTTAIALIATGPELPAGVDTGIRFVTDDAAADHAVLSAAGTEVGEMLHWEDVPPMFTFRDPDGNTFYMVEKV